MKTLTQAESMIPTIALVGRVNVGKSTLFNRLIEEQKAIVSRIPGTTRTSNMGLILWRGAHIRVIDTGGLTFEEGVPLQDDIMRQSERAMKSADIILFVVDAQTGLMPQEKILAKKMRRIITKPVIVVANKVDTEQMETDMANTEFYRLGLGDVFPIAAAAGRNVGDLLDRIYDMLRQQNKYPEIMADDTAEVRVSLIGKPNVGKSSLFNTLIGEERVIVSDIPHTTREPHDTLVFYDDGQKRHRILFVDTAGIRRKAKVAGELERKGIRKSITSIADSDVILFVLDGAEPISQQDKQLGALIERQGKSVIILVNKWDLSEDNSEKKRIEVTDMIYGHFPHLSFAPLLFVSGKTGYRVQQIPPLILHAFQARQTEIPASTLDTFLEHIMREHKPSRGKGTRQPRLLGFRQLATDPPVFELFIKQKTSLHYSYVNFIERKLREQCDFFATPIIIKLSKIKR